MRTDELGRIRLTGFLGDYEVTSRGRVAGFSLDAPGSVEAVATLKSMTGASRRPSMCRVVSVGGG